MEEKEIEMDIFDILMDPDNHEPISLADENGRVLRFEQVAIIPYEVEGEKRLYAVLKPLDEIEGINDDEAIVFRVDCDDDGDSVLNVEQDDELAIKIFNKYYDLLKEATDSEEDDGN